MEKTGVKITRNMPKIKNKIAAGMQAAIEAVTESIVEYSDDFIPKAEGTLRDSGRIHSRPEDGLCVWNTPYAAYQWYGIRADGTHEVKEYTTPGTGTMWAQKAVDTHKKEIEQIAQKAFDKGMKEGKL